MNNRIQNENKSISSLDITGTQLEYLCKKYDLEVTNDVYIRSSIVSKLLHNVFEFGVPYCPKQMNRERTSDTVCPCRYMQNAGVCKCGLFVKKGVNQS